MASDHLHSDRLQALSLAAEMLNNRDIDMADFTSQGKKRAASDLFVTDDNEPGSAEGGEFRVLSMWLRCSR